MNAQEYFDQIKPHSWENAPDDPREEFGVFTEKEMVRFAELYFAAKYQEVSDKFWKAVKESSNK